MPWGEWIAWCAVGGYGCLLSVLCRRVTGYLATKLCRRVRAGLRCNAVWVEGTVGGGGVTEAVCVCVRGGGGRSRLEVYIGDADLAAGMAPFEVPAPSLSATHTLRHVRYHLHTPHHLHTPYAMISPTHSAVSLSHSVVLTKRAPGPGEGSGGGAAASSSSAEPRVL
eukprot:271087-Rhodomonas_salina.2